MSLANELVGLFTVSSVGVFLDPNARFCSHKLQTIIKLFFASRIIHTAFILFAVSLSACFLQYLRNNFYSSSYPYLMQYKTNVWKPKGALRITASSEKKILIMGGTRFIGVFLSRLLVEEGHQVWPIYIQTFTCTQKFFPICFNVLNLNTDLYLRISLAFH